MDDREVLGLREPPAVDGLELGEVRREGDRLVAVVRALLEPGQELLSGSPPTRGAGEEEELLRVLEGEQGPDGVEMGQSGHLLDALTARGTGAREDQPADELRFVLHDHLGDHAAHGEAARQWALENLHEPMTLTDLAEHSHMSLRTFARRFTEEVGMSPGRWLIQQRVDRARHLLETTDQPVDEIAGQVGFAGGTSLRVHLHAAIGISPLTYRRTFRGALSPAH
jgi:AraC-like DNA-binding protein